MEQDYLREKRCPVCGKRFTVIWPHQWAYITGVKERKYYCSWKCLRTLEEKRKESDGRSMKRAKIGLEQKKQAVQIALAGGDPLRYLESKGVKDPCNMWYKIKLDMKEKDPDTYDLLPKRIERKDARNTNGMEVRM